MAAPAEREGERERGIGREGGGERVLSRWFEFVWGEVCSSAGCHLTSLGAAKIPQTNSQNQLRRNYQHPQPATPHISPAIPGVPVA